jgi:DnaK suppressor protein
MGKQSPRLDAEYVEQKRRQLRKLLDELRNASNVAEAEEGIVKNESNLQARQYDHHTQKLDMLEREGNLVARDVERLARVERALEKIEQGTYGLSDVSGERIPRDRLDVMPEATNTLSEQEALERIG